MMKSYKEMPCRKCGHVWKWSLDKKSKPICPEGYGCRSKTNLDHATEMLRELGNIYAVALAEKGHNIDDKSDLMNGLAAYYMLDLKGEFDDLDESVDAVVRIVYEEVRRKLSPIGIGE